MAYRSALSFKDKAPDASSIAFVSLAVTQSLGGPRPRQRDRGLCRWGESNMRVLPPIGI